MTFEELNAHVITWATEKGIILPTPEQVDAQLTKTREEVDEYSHAAREYLSVQQYDPITAPMDQLQKRLENDARMELGDVLITVLVAAACCGIDPVQALHDAYGKIKKRTGRVVDGVFVKD